MLVKNKCFFLFNQTQNGLELSAKVIFSRLLFSKLQLNPSLVKTLSFYWYEREDVNDLKISTIIDKNNNKGNFETETNFNFKKFI